MENLIVLKQLPIIEENLKIISEEIDKKLEIVNSLICTEDTVKDVKKVRAELNKELKELEEQRKNIKSQIMNPYNEFENIYKKYVSDKYRGADTILKGKIDDIEEELKNQKEQEIRVYFEEYREKKNINFITFENANIKIGLSDSMKSLKEQAKAFIDKIDIELQTITTQEYKDEILVEYMKNLDINQSIKDVSDRHLILEQIQDTNEQKNEEIRPIESKEKITSPIEEEKTLTVTLKVTATIPKLKELKNYLNERGYDYE